MEQTYKAYYKSPIGLMEIQATRHAITSIRFCDGRGPENSCPIIQECIVQLDEYFTGDRKDFRLNLAPEGTGFRQKVWQALRQIPYGKTRSYQDIAIAIGNPKACRAVGAANRDNPIPIIIPCHRVIGKNGGLVGYNSGPWRKEWLLRHETGKPAR
ncbi:MAG: methylated-DNA--[protein]-cysteine S-methyltransferase [Clostridiaceae bacterium]|jgi:methylated-DNA-[protein]-cysteine S-methyltransferase|nr:methylated-DNA--[protein]-cysteine S-methyltransferase [Clostridiaceae bacterium]